MSRRLREDAVRTSDRGGYVPGFVDAVQKFVKEHGRDLDERMPIRHLGKVLDERARNAERPPWELWKVRYPTFAEHTEKAKADRSDAAGTLREYVQWRELLSDDLEDCEGMDSGMRMLIAFKRPEGKPPELLTRDQLSMWFRGDWRKYRRCTLDGIPRESDADDARPLYCPRWMCFKVEKSLADRKWRERHAEKRRKLTATSSESKEERSDSDSEEEERLFQEILDAKSELSDKRKSWDAVIENAETKVTVKKTEKEKEVREAEKELIVNQRQSADVIRGAELNLGKKRKAWNAHLERKSKDKVKMEESTCSICFEGLRDHAMVPCGHRCACRTCSVKLTACPVCRKAVEKAIRVYDS